ncbi:MAG TPA: T9SS type A sorting domain-containing protein [Flavobacterium sp.]|nr:T9SS type A sorting domain-containing protein [Flavobacterium sp.]
MKKIYLSILFTLCALSFFAQTTKKVLFLGNSYTQYNNLPSLVQQMATSTNDVLIQDSNTPGGQRLMDHVANQASLTKINANQWDYVVLQEQSQMPAFPLGYVNQNVFPYATQLSDLIKQNHACSVPLFYTTWGRKNGDSQNCPTQPALCTYTGMDDLLQQRYRKMAEDNKGVISPVAQVWRYIRTNHPTIELYSSDESHPSLEGSMAAAYTFYTVIFRKDPTLVTFNSTLQPATATIIKNAVKNIVFNNQENWLMDVNDNFAHFTASLIGGTNVQFQNTTVNATNISWNFGDGGTSTQQNPSHNFATNGTYTVTMSLKVCGKTYTKTRKITISALSNQTFEVSDVKLYPNPTQDFIQITNLNFDEVSIFDINGRKLDAPIQNNEHSIEINLQKFASGSYFIKLRKGATIETLKVVKK